MKEKKMNDIQHIPIEKIHKVKNIRDDSVDIDDLKASIEAHGLLQPILVSVNDGDFHLVAGHRRYNACKALGWEKIPAIVESFKNVKAVQLTENMQRANMLVHEEAKCVFELFQELDISKTRLGQILGRAHIWVERRIGYHVLRTYLIESGKIPIHVINQMTLEIGRIVTRHEKKYWLKMSAAVLGKRWMPDKLEEYCEQIVDPKKKITEKRKNGKTVSKAGKQDIGMFYLKLDRTHSNLKVYCAEESTFKAIIDLLVERGGEIA